MRIPFRNGHVDTETIRSTSGRLTAKGVDGLASGQLARLAADIGRLCDMAEAQAEDLAYARQLLSDACECLARGSDEDDCLLARKIALSLDRLSRTTCH